MRLSVPILLCALLLLPGCRRDLEPMSTFRTNADGEVPVGFSLSVGVQGIKETKMTDAITQALGTAASFRGIEEVYLIPFKIRGPIALGDVRYAKNLQLPQAGLPKLFGANAQDGAFQGLVNNNNAHLYNSVIFKAGTASLLAYGKAPDEDAGDDLADKHHNGVLTPTDLVHADTTSQIIFSLEQILTSGGKTEMDTKVNGILTYLNTIAQAQTDPLTTYQRNSTTVSATITYHWNSPSEYGNYADLAKLFTDFLTNNENAFSGSSTAIQQMLTTLYNRLYPLTSNTSEYLQYYPRSSRNQSNYYYVQQLANKIRTAINNSTYVSTSGSGSNVTVTLNNAYQGVPDSYGIPAGAVAIKWDGSQFKRVTSADVTTLLPPAEAYCFPPCLWYYANSTLRCTDRTDIADEYKQENATWADIFDQYTYSHSVVGGATSAALKDPMHYGVAMLRVTLNPATSPGGTSNLLDGNSNAVAVNNTNFPLTGVIVGEQRTQRFNFTPRSEEAKYVFDTEVGTAYISSTTSSQSIVTLVVETEPGEDVHYALEFKNNSANEFKGADGLIKPGSNFYLIGELEYDQASQNPNNLASVFVKDHITAVTITVKGLASAYNVIPELRDPQLQIGLVSNMDWIQVTPAEVPMY